MKPRTPKSIAGALTKIMAALSDSRCAEIVGRSDSLIRKWADPDHPSQPTLTQALALDLVYVNEGHGEPPILEIYQDMLEDALNERNDREADILMTALSVQSAVGSLSEAIKAALDPKGPGGSSITASERQSILEILDRLEDHTDIIEGAVETR
ncbi:MAG: hypothetical protein OEO83_08250 [Alphaproteobacteria bacterium]|nr:hypothetical protein [Alphaproteobacteria bacterium]